MPDKSAPKPMVNICNILFSYIAPFFVYELPSVFGKLGVKSVR